MSQGTDRFKGGEETREDLYRWGGWVGGRSGNCLWLGRYPSGAVVVEEEEEGEEGRSAGLCGDRGLDRATRRRGLGGGGGEGRKLAGDVLRHHRLLCPNAIFWLPSRLRLPVPCILPLLLPLPRLKDVLSPRQSSSGRSPLPNMRYRRTTLHNG